MTRSMVTRRAAILAGAATVAALALSGCSAGQIAETSNKEPSVYGLNTENADRSVLIRGLAVGYQGVKGYPVGGSAPLEVALYNETAQPITVRITSQPPQQQNPQLAWARQVVLTGPEPSEATTGVPQAAEPSGSRPVARPGGSGGTPGTDETAQPGQTGQPGGGAAPAPTPSLTGGTSPAGTAAPADGRPAEITLAPLSSAIFLPGDPRSLQLVGLSQPLKPGNSVNVVFQFSNGVEPLVVPVGVAVPASPAPRATPSHEGVGEGEGGQGH